MTEIATKDRIHSPLTRRERLRLEMASERLFILIKKRVDPKSKRLQSEVLDVLSQELTAIKAPDAPAQDISMWFVICGAILIVRHGGFVKYLDFKEMHDAICQSDRTRLSPGARRCRRLLSRAAYTLEHFVFAGIERSDLYQRRLHEEQIESEETHHAH